MKKLDEILQSLPEQAEYQNLTQDDYLAWKENPVTKLLMADLYMQTLQAADSIGGDTVDTLAVRSARYTGVREVVQMIDDWKPEYLEQEDE